MRTANSNRIGRIGAQALKGALAVAATVALWGGVGLATSVATSGPVLAQRGACGQLWYERNEIYARNGYCFKTARARSVFGPGCFPPYGRLNGWDKRRVAEIQAEEADLGCPP